MRREVHVRFCERLAVTFRGPTLPGLLPILLLCMHGTEIERPLAIVMTGGLVTLTIFIPLVLPTIYPWFMRRTMRKGGQ
jgi:Cu/Ag efflux pump CusA